MTSKKPVQTIRDGALKATIWKNQSEKGSFYSTQISRTYQDAEGNLKDSDRFSGGELLRVARLATEAYTAEVVLREADKASQAAAASASS